MDAVTLSLILWAIAAGAAVWCAVLLTRLYRFVVLHLPTYNQATHQAVAARDEIQARIRERV